MKIYNLMPEKSVDLQTSKGIILPNLIMTSKY